MEPPAKRVRVGNAPWDEDDDEDANDDELALSATQFDARQDPMYQLDKKRAKSVFKLKSRFEDIFEKYGQHFEGVGDEIDLRTGEIVINNGHLQSLEDEDQDKSEDEEAARASQEAGTVPRTKPNPLVKNLSASGFTPRMLQSDRQQPAGFMPLEVSGQAKLPFLGNSTIDPAWQTPELQLSSQNGVGLESRGPRLAPPLSHGNRPSLDTMGYGIGFGLFTALQRPYRRIASAKDIAPKTLSVPIADGPNQGNVSENDSGDDVLLGAYENISEAAARPHFKKVFKTVALPTDDPEKTASDQKMESEINAYRPTTNSSRRTGRPKTKPMSPSRIFEAIDAGLSELAGDHAKVVKRKTTPRGLNGSPGITENSVSIQAHTQEQTHITDDSSDSQSRRSGRVRREVDRYSQIAWANTRRKIENVITPPETDTEESLISKDLRLQPVRSPETSVIENVDWSQRDMDASLRAQVIGLVDSTTRIVDAAATISDSSYLSDTERAQPSREAPNPSSPQHSYADSKATISSQPDPISRQEIDMLDTAIEQTAPVGFSVEDNADALLACANSESLAGLKSPGIIDQECALEVDGYLHTEKRVSYAAIIADSESESEQADLEDCADADISIELGEAPGSNILEPSREDTGTPIEPRTELSKTPEPVILEIGSSPHQSTSPKPVVQKIPTFSPRVLHPKKDHQSPSAQIPLRPSSKASAQNDRPDIPEKRSPETAPVNHLSLSPPQPRSRPYSPKSQPQIDLKTPKKRRFISSLITDASDDEDEISILSSSVARTPTSDASLRASFVRSRSRASSTVKSSPHKTGQQRDLASSPHHSVLGGGSRRRASPSLPRMAGTDTGAIRYGLRKQPTAGLAQSSPLARTVFLKTPQSSSHQGKTSAGRLGSPTNDSVLTPGGTMRHCGEDGFICDRDFCFTCCK